MLVLPPDSLYRNEQPIDEELIAELRRLAVQCPPHEPNWRGDEHYKRALLEILDREVAVADAAQQKPGVYPRGILTTTSAKYGMSSGKWLQQGYYPGTWSLLSELRRLDSKLPTAVAFLGA